MSKELEELKTKILSVPTMILIVIALFAILLIFAPMMVKASSNFTNGTGFTQTTSNWTEQANLTVTTTTTGWIFGIGVFDARTNFSTAKSKFRVLIDGTVVSITNMTETVYVSTGTILGASYVTSGTHHIAVETSAAPNSKLMANNWTFFAGDMSSSGGGGAGNVSSVTGSPSGTLDCTGTDDITCILTPSGTNFRNDTISTLQTFVNATFVPLSNTSYLKNTSFFCGTNTTCTYNANGSVSISAIGGNGSNYNATYDAKEPGIPNGTSNQFLNGLKSYISLTYANITGFNSTVQSLVTAYGYITNSTAKLSSSSQLPDNSRWSSLHFEIKNGTNDIAINTRENWIAGYNGTFEQIELWSQQTGNLNITLYNNTGDAYICSTAFTSSTGSSSSCSSYSFNQGLKYYYKVISNSGIFDVAVNTRTIRT